MIIGLGVKRKFLFMPVFINIKYTESIDIHILSCLKFFILKCFALIIVPQLQVSISLELDQF